MYEKVKVYTLTLELGLEDNLASRSGHFTPKKRAPSNRRRLGVLQCRSGHGDEEKSQTPSFLQSVTKLTVLCGLSMLSIKYRVGPV
jgi:hypothetical protein